MAEDDVQAELGIREIDDSKHEAPFQELLDFQTATRPVRHDLKVQKSCHEEITDCTCSADKAIAVDLQID